MRSERWFAEFLGAARINLIGRRCGRCVRSYDLQSGMSTAKPFRGQAATGTLTCRAIGVPGES